MLITLIGTLKNDSIGQSKKAKSLMVDTLAGLSKVTDARFAQVLNAAFPIVNTLFGTVNDSRELQ
jgi:hypothetical protein